MNTYTDVFGGHNINQSSLSYKAYGTTLVPLAADVLLQWPFEALDGANVTADKIDVVANAGLTFSMPDAMLASNGEDVLWNNVGANAFTVLDYMGNTLLVVQPGTQWFLYLTSNTSQAGLWMATQFGSSTSVANAATLAGFGLRAAGTKLDQNLLTNISSSSITLNASSRAQVFRNTGGTVVHTLASAATLGNGWFAVEINAGTGTVTITPTPTDLIDGAASKIINPGESLTVYSFGTGFETMGYGRALSSTTTATSIDISGGGVYNMTSPQLLAQVQNFTGTLSADRIVQYGTGVGYWFIYNNTSGAFNTTFRTNASDPGAVVPQGNFSILRSDGTNLDVALTAGLGSVTVINTAAGETTGGPITNTGTIGLANTPVTPASYGDASHVPTVTFDAKGRATAASNTTIAISTSQITDLATFFPPGTMVAYAGAGTLATAAWLPCDGTTRLIADYPALAAVLQTTYGGNGTTTFGLPDTRGRVLAGADGGTNRLRTAWWASADNTNTVGSAGGVDAAQASTFVNFNSSAVNNINFGNVGLTQTGGYVSSASITGIAGGGGITGVQIFDSVVVSGYTGINANFNISVNGAGGTFTSGAFTNVQPTLIIRHIIKT